MLSAQELFYRRRGFSMKAGKGDKRRLETGLPRAAESVVHLTMQGNCAKLCPITEKTRPSHALFAARRQALSEVDRKEKHMTLTQAARAWEVSENEVETICKAMGLDTDNIPEDTVPVYLPDPLYEGNPHRFYLYLMDVIANTHMEIKGMDQSVLETCVAQLKEKKLIVLKAGAHPESLDYRDYVISADRALYNDWVNSHIKASVSFIDKVISFFSGGGQ